MAKRTEGEIEKLLRELGNSLGYISIGRNAKMQFIASRKFWTSDPYTSYTADDPVTALTGVLNGLSDKAAKTPASQAAREAAGIAAPTKPQVIDDGLDDAFDDGLGD